MDIFTIISDSILPLTIFIIGIGFFIGIIIYSRVKADQEEGLIPIYSNQCGGQFGLFRATFPFVRLTLYDDFLVIKYFPKTLIIKYDNIRIMSPNGFLGNGLEITSKNIENYDPPIIWSFNNAKIKNLINERIELNKKTNFKHST